MLYLFSFNILSGAKKEADSGETASNYSSRASAYVRRRLFTYNFKLSFSNVTITEIDSCFVST